jgi:hypothetical protein
MMGFWSFGTASKTLTGIEAMNMIRKGQVRGVAKGDVLAQARLSQVSLVWLRNDIQRLLSLIVDLPSLLEALMNSVFLENGIWYGQHSVS